MLIMVFCVAYFTVMVSSGIMCRSCTALHSKLVNQPGLNGLQHRSKLRGYSTKTATEPKSDNLKCPLIGTATSELNFTNIKPRVSSLLMEISSRGIEFEKTDTGQVIVYTDGSCLNNNSKDGDRKSGIGVYWASDDHPLNISLPHGGTRLTNNRAEIAAVHSAVIVAKALKIERLCLYTDSKLTVNACKYWLPAWEFNNWRLKGSDRPVANQDMWKKLSEDLLHVLVDFRSVPSSNEGIRKAHKLAQNGAKCSPIRECMS